MSAAAINPFLWDEVVIKRAENDWSEYAGERVRVERIGGVLYAFGSELACLRLEHRMRVGRAAYSENLQTWTYCTDRK
jgi:hypothetical protein